MLFLTCWIDLSQLGKAVSKEITFSGRRVNVCGAPQPWDTFTQGERIEGVIPGRGPVSITSRIHGISPGTWNVTARLADSGDASVVPGRTSGPAAMVFNDALGARLGAARFSHGGVPGVIPFAWITFVVLGVIIGLALQTVLLRREHIEVAHALLVSLSTIVAGSVCAKIWFVLKYRRPWSSFATSGMCVQGSIVGGTIFSWAGLMVSHIGVGAFYDATAPGLFLGLAIGRIGCFFAGCCAGRPTASRWGVWASDGRLGTRRVPTQLLESITCLVIGLATLVLQNKIAIPGMLFVSGWASYTLCRQVFLLPLRAVCCEPSSLPQPGQGPARLT